MVLPYERIMYLIHWVQYARLHLRFNIWPRNIGYGWYFYSPQMETYCRWPSWQWRRL